MPITLWHAACTRDRSVGVPNALIANQVTLNLTSDDLRLVVSMPIGIAASHELAQEVIGCPVTILGPSSVTLTLKCWCAETSQTSQFQTDVFE